MRRRPLLAACVPRCDLTLFHLGWSETGELGSVTLLSEGHQDYNKKILVCPFQSKILENKEGGVLVCFWREEGLLLLFM